MKQSILRWAAGRGKTPGKTTAIFRSRTAAAFSVLVLLLAGTACQKSMSASEADQPMAAATVVKGLKIEPDAGLLPQTLQELKDARNATARYQNINNAIADGYADIDVVRENMGYHFLKASLLDDVFDPAKPEILVYNKKHNGKQELVALEYAVPIPLTPDKAPEGFTGTADVWKYDTEFNLWLLHAWVWAYNPDGVFKPNNPLVHLHH